MGRPVVKALAIILAVLVSAPAMAQSTGKSLAKQAVDIVFTELEKQIIDTYFRTDTQAHRGDDREMRTDRGQKEKRSKKAKQKGKGKKKGLPPGLAKKKRLPPGLARQLERRGKLPPGLAKRDLPQGLETHLPEPWPGTERKIVGNDVVLLEKGTDLILDLLRDVILR